MQWALPKWLTAPFSGETRKRPLEEEVEEVEEQDKSSSPEGRIVKRARRRERELCQECELCLLCPGAMCRGHRWHNRGV